MPTHENKKNHGQPKADSIFLSIAPQPAAARSEPRPFVAPAVAPEQMTALKTRLDLLEKNIAAMIEQKLAAPAAAPEKLTELGTRLDSLEKNIAAMIEQKLAAPAATHKQVTAVGNRLDSLEKNLLVLIEKKLSEKEAAVGGAAEKRANELLSGFAGLATRFDGFKSLGAAQVAELEKYGIAVKNVASELLKTLDERQKSSKLDQRLHDQLEKSWVRVEALEKKLGEAYRVSMETQLKGDAEKKAEVDALAEFGRKTASLEAGFSELRNFVGATLAKDESTLNETAVQFNRRAGELEKKISDFNGSMELLHLKGEETVKRLSGAGVKVDNMAEILDRIDPEKYEIHLKQLHGELSEIRQAFKDQSDHFWEKFLDFNLIAEEFKVKSQTLEVGLEKAVNGNEQMLERAFENIGAIIEKSLARFMADLQERNRDQFTQLSANYDSALDTLSQVGSVCSSIEYVSKRLEGYGKTLSTFVTQVGGGDRLSSLTGVSGIVVRENFGALTSMAADLKRERDYLEAARKEIADKTNRVIKGGSGEAV